MKTSEALKTVTKNLEILSLSDGLEITFSNDRNEYDVKVKEQTFQSSRDDDDDEGDWTGMEMTISLNGEKPTAKYYVTGVYNSGTDWARINMEQLSRLKKFFDLVTK